MMNKQLLALTPLALACKCVLAQSLPVGGTIVQGQGSISGSDSALVIQQRSQRMIADWQSFSIGADKTVRFEQPSSASVALNRVVGNDPSRIYGSLTSNGRVYLQNPNGVLFAPGAQVNVGSLVATTLKADPQQFMAAGKLQLSGGDGAGEITNEGSITVSAGGHAVLAGPRVTNNGTIIAPNGTVALAAGSNVSVDPTGAGLVTINVSGAAVGASLVNSGTLVADGGRVSLQAAAADAATRRVMQVDGIVRARSIEQQGGEIILSGGNSGIVAVNGTLDASGVNGAGGTVKVLGDRVLLDNAARIDATGASGGTVRIGGGFQGQGEATNASITQVKQGARIDASARERGNGGDVVVWSDGVTSYAGDIAARGGNVSGDGGRVEVSGKGRLDFSGQVDTRATSGKTGSLLLDPLALEIGTDVDVNGDGTEGDDLVGTTLDYDTYDWFSKISAEKVQSLLATSDVTLQAQSGIDVTAPITVAEHGANTTLTLNAFVVSVDAPMTLNNTALNIDTQRVGSDAIFIEAPVQSLRSVALTASLIELDADVTVPHLYLASHPTSRNPEIEQRSGRIDADTVQVDASNATVTLTSEDNRFNWLDFVADNGAATVGTTPSGQPLLVGATVGGDFMLRSGVDIAQFREMTIGGDFGVATPGNAMLDNAANDFQGTALFQVDGNLRLHDMNDLTAGGVSNSRVNITANGLFSLMWGIGGSDSYQPTYVEIASAGFDNSNGGLIRVQDGGRFIIRSSDYTKDVIGAIGFSANGLRNVNYTVLNGWVGADPTLGNGYYTNRTGTIDAPNSDRPPISRVYDRTTHFDFNQTGESALAWLLGAGSSTGLGHYTVVTDGDFADPTAGTNKQYTVAGTNNVVALMADKGSTVYGLRYDSFTRPAGVVGAEGPGNAISEITPITIYGNGVEGVDRMYDGTNTVRLTIDGARLNGGVLDGDDVGLTAGNLTGTMADGEVGIGKAVTEDGALVLSGRDARNYVLVDLSKPTATITDLPPPPPPPPASPAVPVSRDPQASYRDQPSLSAVPPSIVELRTNELVTPTRALPVRVATATETVTDSRTLYFYFPYRSSTIDEGRSAADEQALLQAMDDGFIVERVRGFTSPEGPRVAHPTFEGNNELAQRRAAAALARLRELSEARGTKGVPDSVIAEGDSELHALIELDARGNTREAEGSRLADYAVAAFGTDAGDAAQRTPAVELELQQARTPAEKAQVVYPQLRRVEVQLTRQRTVTRAPIVASAE